jgi:prolyl-tRNA synthetase
MWYHFATKERDEPRPGGALIRLREFIMKDAYSFDRDEEGLDRSFRLQKGAYDKIFDRCGLDVYAVQAEPGMMGGSESMDYLAPAGSGQNTLVTCENGDYAADLEIALATPRAPEFPAALDAPEEVETPGATTIESLAGFLGVDPAATSKAMPIVRESDGELVLGLVRGDDRLEDAKVESALGSAFRPATVEEIRTAFGADPGSIGPVGFSGPILADETLRDGQYVTGANRTGWHLRGVEHGRDFEATFADLRQPKEGDTCPVCGGALRFQTAIEVGHIFKLGTRYSVPLGASFLDEDGQEKPIVMGSYGIGPARIMAAAIEQHHDEHGIAWPPSLAPYDVHVVPIQAAGEEAVAAAETLASGLEERGVSVLYDDRDRRPGEKFADADLLGMPVRITVGKKTLEDGKVDLLVRAGRAEDRVAIEDVPARVEAVL